MFEHVFARCFGECFEVREAFEPAIKVGQHCLNLRLLRHEFGDDGLVKRGCGTPRQWSLRGGIPSGECLLKGFSL